MDSFFGIGLFELVMIAVVALLVLGPERLPGAMREVAKWMRQLRNLSSEFQSQFSEEFKMLDEINPKRIINEAIDPNATPRPAAKPLAPKPVTPAAPKQPAPKPAATVTATTVTAATVTNGETQNTILPPANTAPTPASMPAPEAPADNSPAAAPADSDQAPEAAQ